MAETPEIPEEIIEGELAEGALPPPEGVGPEGEMEGSVISHTVDELPEAQGKGVGERIILEITGVSEDGNSMDFRVVAEPVEAPPAPVPAPAPGPGRSEIAQSLL